MSKPNLYQNRPSAPLLALRFLEHPFKGRPVGQPQVQCVDQN